MLTASWKLGGKVVKLSPRISEVGLCELDFRLASPEMTQGEIFDSSFGELSRGDNIDDTILTVLNIHKSQGKVSPGLLVHELPFAESVVVDALLNDSVRQLSNVFGIRS